MPLFSIYAPWKHQKTSKFLARIKKPVAWNRSIIIVLRKMLKWMISDSPSSTQKNVQSRKDNSSYPASKCVCQIKCLKCLECPSTFGVSDCLSIRVPECPSNACRIPWVSFECPWSVPEMFLECPWSAPHVSKCLCFQVPNCLNAKVPKSLSAWVSKNP